MPAALARAEAAPAKVNLTLRVVGRRPDGYHELDSLVAFARVGDRLEFAPGGPLALSVDGPFAAAAGNLADNLVLKAARELARRVPGLMLGRFLEAAFQWSHARDLKPDAEELALIEAKLKSGLMDDNSSNAEAAKKKAGNGG